MGYLGPALMFVYSLYISIALFTGTQWPTEIVKRYIAAKLNAVLMQLSLTYLEVVFLHVLVYDSIAVKPNDFL